MNKRNHNGQEPLDPTPGPEPISPPDAPSAPEAMLLPTPLDSPGPGLPLSKLERGEGGEVNPPDWVSDPASAYAEIQRLRDEAGRYRTRANELSSELEALAASLRQGEIRSAILLEAARAGIADPSDALALADLAGVALDGGGAVTGAAEAVAALVAAKPYLLTDSSRAGWGETPQPGDTPAILPTNPGGGPALRSSDLRALSSEAIARMDPDELRAALAK